jgi:hypothetical protein
MLRYVNLSQYRYLEYSEWTHQRLMLYLLMDKELVTTCAIYTTLLVHLLVPSLETSVSANRFLLELKSLVSAALTLIHGCTMIYCSRLQ